MAEVDVDLPRVAVMGAGSWGTAYALLCVDAGAPVRLWARRDEVADEINTEHTNSAYLGDCVLPDALHASSDPQEVLDDAAIVVLAVPSSHVGRQLDAWGGHVGDDATLVSLIKGVDVETRRFGSEVIADAVDCDPSRVVVVSGPNLAKECAQRLPAATVAAGATVRAQAVQAASMAPSFRVYTNPDRVGVEVGGAVKNVIALASGIAHGMGFGDNTKAAVITRGLAEMQRLGTALGGDALTFSGLAGVGDLVATCMSPKSRNRTVGQKIGEGMALDDIISSMNMVAEGVKSSKAIVALAEERGVEMPIAQAVVGIVHDDVDPRAAITALMSRDAKPELHGMPTT